MARLHSMDKSGKQNGIITPVNVICFFVKTLDVLLEGFIFPLPHCHEMRWRLSNRLTPHEMSKELLSEFIKR